jgi:hypothetical protein
MAERIEKMSIRVAFSVLAKDRPDDLFGAAFFDLRQKAKDLKEKWSQEAKESLQNSLISSLKEDGYNVVSAELSLGKYRGSHFVTSAKLSVKVKSEGEAKKLAGYLQRFSPKYNLKAYDRDSGVASYNIR